MCGTKEQNLIDTLAIRSMSKGNIQLIILVITDLLLIIIRILLHQFVVILTLWYMLQYYLDGGKSADQELYETKCLHSSTMEGLATSAERDSIKYMQVKYMQDHQDQEF
jgi:ribonuclease R